MHKVVERLIDIAQFVGLDMQREGTVYVFYIEIAAQDACHVERHVVTLAQEACCRLHASETGKAHDMRGPMSPW